MDRPTLPPPFRWEGEHIAAELPGARVLLSTRRGGVSPAPFDSLNLGRLTADEDGQATALPHTAALVFVADCLPVLLAAGGAVAAVHCGWRGLAAGIVAEGVRALRELGAHGPVAGVVGAGARGCCYEVGEEVLEHFQDVPTARKGSGTFLALDLPTVAAARLAEAGVAEIHDVGLCTMCRNDLFFSHRADGGVTGRQAGVVWRS